MTEEKFSPQDSLQLIQSMILKAQKDIGDNSSQFLLWGWMTFIACTAQFILKHYLNYDQHYYVWLLTLPTAVISFFIGRNHAKRSSKHARSYVGESMKYLWMGMGISFFVLSMILTRMGWGNSIFPFFMLLYGLGTFVTGKFLQFAPYVWGGLAAWILAIACTFFSYDYQMLFAAAAVLLSYIIPAYMLKSRNRQSDGNKFAAVAI